MSNTVNNYTETDLGNISLNPRGEYDNSAAYEYLDTVSYRGGSYFCLAELETTITGIAPDAGRDSEHWQMIAAPGDMTPEYTAAYNDVIKKAVQVETSRAAVELAQQEIEAVQTDVQQLHSDTVQAAQEAENSKNSAANSAQSAEQSRKTVSESEQNINRQIAGFDSRVSEAVEQSKEEINTTKQQAINTITNQQTTSVNTVKTEGEKIIIRVGNDAKTVADDRATVEEATQTVLNNAQEVARNAQTVASNTENAAASAESAKTSADNAAQSAKGVEDASKQIEQNKKDVASLKEDLKSNFIDATCIIGMCDINDNSAYYYDNEKSWIAGGYTNNIALHFKPEKNKSYFVYGYVQNANNHAFSYMTNGNVFVTDITSNNTEVIDGNGARIVKLEIPENVTDVYLSFNKTKSDTTSEKINVWEGKYLSSYDNNYYSHTNFADGDTITKYYTKEEVDAIVGNSFPKIGKYHAIGDSITYGYYEVGKKYYDYFHKYCGIETVTHDATIGCNISVSNENNDMISKLSNIPSGVDLISIFGGTNDWGHDQPLGTMDNTSEDTRTFYGAMKYCCEYLLENFNNKAFFITPIQRNVSKAPADSQEKGTVTNGKGNTLDEFVNAMIEVCDYYGIPCIDMYHNVFSGHDTTTINLYMPDGLHPNDAGHSIMGRKIAKFINYQF